jgi:hypothetical protein
MMTSLLQHCEEEHSADLGIKINYIIVIHFVRRGTMNCTTSIGTKTIKLNSFVEFEAWKEKEEEATYTTYVKNQTESYFPKSMKVGI